MGSFGTTDNAGWRSMTRSLIFLVISALLAIAAAVLGIDDNPPGVLLAYLAAFAFVLAFVHPWRTARQFRRLVYASVIGTVLLIVLNNLFALVAHDPSTGGAIQKVFEGLAVTAFFLGTLVFPAAFIVGVAGLAIVFVRGRRLNAGS